MRIHLQKILTVVALSYTAYSYTEFIMYEHAKSPFTGAYLDARVDMEKKLRDNFPKKAKITVAEFMKLVPKNTTMTMVQKGSSDPLAKGYEHEKKKLEWTSLKTNMGPSKDTSLVIMPEDKFDIVLEKKLEKTDVIDFTKDNGRIHFWTEQKK